jgi:tripartite-type tricarboxylate transporter receptor subunit TctC
MSAVGLAAGVFATGMARADTFPSKPIHLIVPFTPGGTTELAGFVWTGIGVG